MVHGAFAGWTVVLVAGGQRGGVECPDGGVLVRGECDVDVLGERALVAHEREGEAGARELHAIRRVMREAQPGVWSDRRIEAPRDLGIAHTDPQVVDAAFRRGALAVVDDGLGAVAVRVEQEGAVVVGVVTGRSPGAPSSG